MRTRTRFRPLSGILLLDKPSGMSSNQALQRVRHLYRAEKAGHTGSLDPLATGLLPVCFGEATKVAGLLLGAGKAYETVARLGTTTDTDDADGRVLRERPVPMLDRSVIEMALEPFHGRIVQRAPIYSALKRGGERLYAVARRGELVEAPERPVDVQAFRLVDHGGGWIRLHVECGSGTYVRSLVRDLGEALGCGAHVGELRRLWVDPFRAPAMATLDELQAESADEAALDRRLLPIEDALQRFPAVRLDMQDSGRFGHGQPVAVPGSTVALAQRSASTVADGDRGAPNDGPDRPAAIAVVYDPAGRLLGLASTDGVVLRPQRLFNWAATGTA